MWLLASVCRGPAASVFTKCAVSFSGCGYVERRLHTLPDGSVEMSTLRTVTEEEGEESVLRRLNRANGWNCASIRL